MAQVQGAYSRANGLLEESFHFWQKLGSSFGVALCLAGLAVIAESAGQHPAGARRAARLFGAADAQHANIDTLLDPVDRAAYARSQAAVRARLGGAAFAAAWAEGHALAPEQAIAAPEPAPEAAQTTAAPTARPQPAYPAGLTEREVEVLRLLAQGLSYAEIAEKLVISPRTVNRHLSTIYGKLDVSSRHAAARFAIEHDLV